MQPTWATADGSVQLYLGDCLEVLPTLAEGSVDAVVTDPPYGINHQCNFNTRGRSNLAICTDYPNVYGDHRPFDPSPLLEMNVPAVLWGANYFSDKLPASSGWLVWDKERPDELDQSTCELAWSNCVRGVRRFRHLWHGMMRASEHGDNYHPTQKPVALYEWLLSLRWIPRGVILDPYMGAGPCGVACALLGRPYIGVEVVPEYFDIAVKRIEAELNRQPLFEPAPEIVQRELL